MPLKEESICNLGLLLVFSSVLMAQNVSLSSHLHPSLDYPIRVVEAEPYLRPGTNMRQEGDFKAVYRKLGVLPAERMRLPVPGSTWRLDGRVGRTKDGTIYAGFGTYLYWSKDEGKTWTGRRLQGLPNTQKEAVSAQAFGVAGQYIYVAHRASGLPPLPPGEVENPAVVRRGAGHLPQESGPDATGDARPLVEHPPAAPPPGRPPGPAGLSSDTMFHPPRMEIGQSKASQGL